MTKLNHRHLNSSQRGYSIVYEILPILLTKGVQIMSSKADKQVNCLDDNVLLV